jgi:hypothetical protein
VDTVK